MSNETSQEHQTSTKSKIGSDEANLIWDEYKYRHDLIWRYLIRSTIAVIALITISYSNTIRANNEILYIMAALLAIIYLIFSFIVLSSELRLYENVKVIHRQRQKNLYNLHIESDTSPKKRELIGGFSKRVRFYLGGLLVLALVASGILVSDYMYVITEWINRLR